MYAIEQSAMVNPLIGIVTSSWLQAYVHKDLVYVAELPELGGKSVTLSPSTLPNTDGSPVEQVRDFAWTSHPCLRTEIRWDRCGLRTEWVHVQVSWVPLRFKAVLVVALRSGVQVWDASGTALIGFRSLANCLGLREPRASKSSRVTRMSLCHFSTYACVGGVLAHYLAAEGSFMRGIAGHASSGRILVGSSTGTIAVLSVGGSRGESVRATQQLTCHTAPIVALASDERSGRIVSADDSGHIVVWDPSTLDIVQEFTGPKRPCSGVAIRDDLVVASYLDGSLRAFRLTFPSPVAEVYAHVRAVTSLAAHPSEPLIASGGEDGLLTVWRIGGEEVLSLVFRQEVTDHMLTGVAFTPRSAPHVMVSAYDVLYLRLFCSERGC